MGALAAGAAAIALRRALRRRRASSFAGKVVVVTGGSRGLGLEIARVFADEGARLVLLARTPEELSRAAGELAERSRRGAPRTIACDLVEPDQVHAAVERIERTLGGIDVLVNNAGVILASPLEQLDERDFAAALDVHFWGPLRLSLAAVETMRRRGGGRIVNVASIGGLVAVPHLLPYCASKFALVGLSDGLRAELAKDGIRVTTVCPGLMRTGSHVNAWFKGRREVEYSLFSLLAGSPLTSIDAGRAARRIVEACRHGERFLVLSPQARLLRRFSTLAPEWWARAAALAGRLLPSPSDDGEAAAGRDLSGRWAPSFLTRLADRAARRNNELEVRPPPPSVRHPAAGTG